MRGGKEYSRDVWAIRVLLADGTGHLREKYGFKVSNAEWGDLRDQAVNHLMMQVVRSKVFDEMMAEQGSEAIRDEFDQRVKTVLDKLSKQGVSVG